MSSLPIRFSWLQSDTIEDMASPSWSPSRVASVSSLAPRNDLVAVTAAVSTFPTLDTELFPQAVAGTSSAQAIVTSLTQAVSSPVRTVHFLTRAVAFVSTHDSQKSSCNDERLSPAKQFCSGEELFCTRLGTPPLRELSAPPLRRAARGRRGTGMVVALPPAASAVSTLRMEV